MVGVVRRRGVGEGVECEDVGGDHRHEHEDVESGGPERGFLESGGSVSDVEGH